MNFFKTILAIITFLVLGLSFMACDKKASHATQNEAIEKHGKEYTSAYICPMHCEGSGSDSPGKCPVCGMDYVKNESHMQGKSHDHDHHEGHNHDAHDHSKDHEGHNHNHHDHEGHNH